MSQKVRPCDRLVKVIPAKRLSLGVQIRAPNDGRQQMLEVIAPPDLKEANLQAEGFEGCTFA